MSPMEIFLLCVGLGVLVVFGFILKFICDRHCHGRCLKHQRNRDFVVPTISRGHTIIHSNSRLPTIVASNDARLPASYMPLLSTRATQPHALIRAEPVGPGEPAVFLAFNFPDDNLSESRRDSLPTIQAFMPASLAGRVALPEEGDDVKYYDETLDQPPRYEDLFPNSAETKGLQTINEEDNS